MSVHPIPVRQVWAQALKARTIKQQQQILFSVIQQMNEVYESPSIEHGTQNEE